MDLSVAATHDTAPKRSRNEDEDGSGSKSVPLIPAPNHGIHSDAMMDVVNVGDSSVTLPVFNGAPQSNALDLTAHHEEPSTSTTVSINSESDVKLSNVKFIRTLNENPKNKMYVYEGEYHSQPVVVVLEKTPISEDNVKGMLVDTETTASSLDKDFVNDIYGKYNFHPVTPGMSAIRTTIIHPATNKHIDKYTRHDVRLIRETKADYESITLPFITGSQLNLDWVIQHPLS